MGAGPAKRRPSSSNVPGGRRLYQIVTGLGDVTPASLTGADLVGNRVLGSEAGLGKPVKHAPVSDDNIDAASGPIVQNLFARHGSSRQKRVAHTGLEITRRLFRMASGADESAVAGNGKKESH